MENLLRKNNIMFHEKERKMKAIMKDETNNKCIDCNNSKPEYISLNNACFICKSCFKMHQNFPINISKTIKNNLKSLNLKELQYLYFGGNKKLLEFIKYEYPKLIKLNPLIAYKTIAMEYYRNWLKYLIEGGNKPHKPDIEIAYKSIDDKEFINKNFLNNNNNDGNVITIDFFNDCYNYNDKYNHTITNFINKKNNRNNNINLYDTDKNFYFKKNNYNSKKDIFNYNKDINLININKDNDINNNKYSNTQTIDLFSHTQSNFLSKNNNLADYVNINKKKYNRKGSAEDIIMDSNNKRNFDAQNYLNKNNIINYNDKSLKPFRTNNNIYVKPKHNALKSFEKNSVLNPMYKNYNETKDNNINNEKELYNEKNKEKINNIDIIKVKVKRSSKDYYKKFEEIKEAKNKINNEKIKINIKKNNINDFDNASEDINNNDNVNYNDNNIISKNNIKTKLIKKQYNYNLSDLNNMNYIVENKGKKVTKDNKEINKNNENNIMRYKDNIDNSLNINSSNNNNLVFKKKNLKNSFFLNPDKKTKRNYSTVQHSQFEILPKKKMNATNDEIKSNESNDDSLSMNTTRTLTLNKSMKHFYSRYPRKMNRTKTKKRKLNESKKRDEKIKEKKMQKLKKEKSEIIQSLKILLKKKNELSKKEDSEKEEEEYEEEEDEIKKNGDDDDSDKYEESDIINKYKKNNKKMNINLLLKKRNDELKKKIFYQMNNTNKNKKDSSSERENDDEEREKAYKHQKIAKKENKKKIQSQDNINKGLNKVSIKGKYKKKEYKY